MFDKLPNLIDPLYFVQHNKRFVSRVKQEIFPRLKDVTLSQAGLIDISIEFYYDRVLRFPAFKLSLKTTLVLECQRSLEAFDYEVESEIKGIFVETLSLIDDDLPSDVEIYEFEGLDNDKLSLWDLIEDELLLATPISPINDETEMGYENPIDEALVELEAQKELETKPNPFAVLKGLNTQ